LSGDKALRFDGFIVVQLGEVLLAILNHAQLAYFVVSDCIVFNIFDILIQLLDRVLS